ncbi:MAG: ABC transporter permease [Microbacteriaceae bacterium]
MSVIENPMISAARASRLMATRSGGIVASGALAVILLWAVGAYIFANPTLFPGPIAVGKALVDGFANGSLLEATGASLARVAAGLALGTAMGVVLGLLSGSSRVLEALFEPFISMFRFIPPLAWFAPVLLWFGTGEESKIILIMYTSVFVVAVSTAAGVKAVPKNMIRMARTSGASSFQLFFAVRLPASVPYILTGIRIAMGNAFMTVVSAEMLGASTGLGVVITKGGATTNVHAVLAALIILGVLGLLTDRLYLFLVRRYGGRFNAKLSVEN